MKKTLAPKPKTEAKDMTTVETPVIDEIKVEEKPEIKNPKKPDDVGSVELVNKKGRKVFVQQQDVERLLQSGFSRA